jgi:ribosomal protein L29
MAVIKKSELRKMSPAERVKKIAELEKAMLELRGEGKKDKTKPLRKAIAKLKTPLYVKTAPAAKAAQPARAPQPLKSGKSQ